MEVFTPPWFPVVREKPTFFELARYAYFEDFLTFGVITGIGGVLSFVRGERNPGWRWVYWSAGLWGGTFLFFQQSFLRFRGYRENSRIVAQLGSLTPPTNVPKKEGLDRARVM